MASAGPSMANKGPFMANADQDPDPDASQYSGNTWRSCCSRGSLESQTAIHPRVAEERQWAATCGSALVLDIVTPGWLFGRHSVPHPVASSDAPELMQEDLQVLGRSSLQFLGDNSKSYACLAPKFVAILAGVVVGVRTVLGHLPIHW